MSYRNDFNLLGLIVDQVEDSVIAHTNSVSISTLELLDTKWTRAVLQ